ncbi:MAG: 2-methylcitrate dehydratase [Betaproteobacteria bacterium]|nr:2-methylcitrate dehydratase [Betaproteobacteria bacterium]
MNSTTDDVSLGASRRLATHAAGLTFEKLPADTVQAFKRTLLDFLTCAISGAAMPVSQALLGYFVENDATRISSVIGNGAKLSAPNAALVTGANVHGLDFDDGHTQGSAHAAGVIFPAVMAVAQQRGSTAHEIAAAVVCGYDVMCRIAATMHPESARRGYHNTALAGVFGATAAVSNLLKLDGDKTLHALGLAGSFSAGIREYLDEGAEIKRIHPGKAARDGIICAEFAKRGITGPSKILEGRYGFFATHAAPHVKWPRLFEGLGERYEIASVYHKPYPCCRHYHAVIEGIKELQREHRFKADEVEHADIGMYAVGFNGHDYKHCDSLLDAQMSAPVAAALAIVLGDVTATMFVPATLDRPDVRALIERIDARIDDECERIYPGVRSGSARIKLKNGTVLEKRVLEPKGEVKNPMTDADLEAKFHANCDPIIGDARSARIVADVWQFERLKDVTPFFTWG